MAMEFSEQGIAAVVDGDGWLYIDRQGRPVVRPFPFDNGPDYFVEGLSRYREKGKIGFIDPAGRIVIPAAFDFAFLFSEGRAAVCNGCGLEKTDYEQKMVVGGKWGYIDRSGRIVIPLEYERAGPFADGRAEVIKDGRGLSLDRPGREIK